MVHDIKHVRRALDHLGVRRVGALGLDEIGELGSEIDIGAFERTAFGGAGGALTCLEELWYAGSWR